MKRFLYFGVLFFAAACSDSVDKAAKKRIFSPEDPPQAVAAASEKISVADLADDPRLTRRVLEMGAAESVERLGAHLFEATSAFEWSLGERMVQLTETRTVLSAKGGISGDFLGTMENSRDQGFEVLRWNSQVYAKNRYGKFRERRRDLGMAERSREELRGVLKEFDALLGRRLKLTSSGNEAVGGRPAVKFTASLAPGNETLERALPALYVAKNGADEGTRLRQAFFKKSRAKSITGNIWVDQATGVVLKADLVGAVTVPQDTGPAPELKLKLDLKVSQVGRSPGLTVPPDALPDVDKPQGIADALDRFGIPRGAQDAGTPLPPGSADPDDDESAAR